MWYTCHIGTKTKKTARSGKRSPGPTHTASAKKAAERRALVLQLRIDGFTFRDIGKQLGISHQRAYQLMSDGIKDIKTENAQELRVQQQQRLTLIFNRLRPKIEGGDEKAASVAIKAIQTLMRLHPDLEAPRKVDVTSGGRKIEQPPAFTDAGQLMEVLRNMGRAQPARAVKVQDGEQESGGNGNPDRS